MNKEPAVRVQNPGDKKGLDGLSLLATGFYVECLVDRVVVAPVGRLWSTLELTAFLPEFIDGGLI
jgi:hypothetical protein